MCRFLVCEISCTGNRQQPIPWPCFIHRRITNASSMTQTLRKQILHRNKRAYCLIRAYLGASINALDVLFELRELFLKEGKCSTI